MTPTEAAAYLGISRVFMVCFGNEPRPPFDRECKAMAAMDEVVWSIVGDAGCDANPETLGHLDEILRLAGEYPNITGGVFDDFFGFGDRDERYSPEVLASIRGRMRGKGLGLWVAVYERNLDDPIGPYMENIDGIIVGVWNDEDLARLGEMAAKARKVAPGKKVLMCSYLYYYGMKREFAAEETLGQLDTLAGLVRSGEADGVLLAANTVCDLGYEAVGAAKAWLAEHGDEPV